MGIIFAVIVLYAIWSGMSLLVMFEDRNRGMENNSNMVFVSFSLVGAIIAGIIVAFHM